MGCTTTDGGSGGWIIVDQPETSPPPSPQQPAPPKKVKKNRGQERAARNHINSAYRFMQKNKPDHAMKELEKAREKGVGGFWYHYYMGGCYYFKGIYDRAVNSWKAAYRHTQDHRLRSRLRTCQSYAVNYMKGDESSVGFLKMAIDTDGENRHARILMMDLTGVWPGFTDSRSNTQAGSKPGFDDPSRSDDADDRYEEDKNKHKNDGTEGRGDGKGKSKGKKGYDKDDTKNGKSGKKKDKYKKIRDKQNFSAYFLIEMP